MTHRISLSRRATLLGATALAMARPAWAEEKVVIGTWGGDYANLLTKNIEKPLLGPKGIEVVQDQAPDSARRAKLVAEKQLRRGTTDVQAFAATQLFEMNEAEALEKIDYSKLPNAANLMPQMKYAYGVGQIYSGKVILYNPKLIKDPPQSFA